MLDIKVLDFYKKENLLIREEYTIIFIFLISAIFLTLTIAIASYFLAKQNPEVEKLSSYECGFEPYEDSRNTFDIKFCVIAVIFIIFDIEIMFLIPWCVSLAKLNILGFWTVIDFLIELGIGFFYIWHSGALNWN